MAPSDVALVGQVLAGERQAFGLLVERYGALVTCTTVAVSRLI